MELPLTSKGEVVAMCYFIDVITVNDIEDLDLDEMTNIYYLGNLYLTFVGVYLYVLFRSTMT